jgi:hypothetical protein
MFVLQQVLDKDMVERANLAPLIKKEISISDALLCSVGWLACHAVQSTLLRFSVRFLFLALWGL